MKEGASGFLFVLLDIGLYALLLAIIVESLRLLLLIFAKHDAALERTRCMLTTAATLFLAYAIQISLMPIIGLATLPIIVICCTLVVHFISWPRMVRSLMITTLWIAIIVGSSIGLTSAADYFFPDRETVEENVARSKEVLENMDSEGVQILSPKEVIAQIKLGLDTWTTALVGAGQILSDEDSVNKMTAEHTDALRELDLVADEEGGPTQADLAALGIHEGSAMTDQEVLRFKMMDKEATAEDRLSALSAFLDKASENGETPDGAIKQFQRMTNTELTPELADDVRGMLGGTVEGDAPPSTNLLQALLIAADVAALSGNASEEIAEDEILDPVATALPEELPDDLPLDEVALTELEATADLPIEESEFSTNAVPEDEEVIIDYLGGKDTETAEGATELAVEDLPEDLTIEQLEEYAEYLSEEDYALLLEAYADKLVEAGYGEDPDALPTNAVFEAEGLNVAGVFLSKDKDSGVLCNGDLVSIGSVIAIDVKGDKRYWKLFDIRDRRPIWVPQERSASAFKEIGSSVSREE